MTDKPAWDAWDKLLSATARSRSKTNHDEALYELAIELRDRLRQSQRDLEEARAAAQQQLDLLAEQAGQQHAVLTTQAVQQQGAVAAAWENERQHTARVLSTFHDEVLRLTHEVAQQAGAMEAQQAAAQEAQAQAAAALRECQAMASQQQADAAAALSAHRAAAAQQHHQAASALVSCQAAAAQQRDEAASALAACQAAAAKQHAEDLLHLKQCEAAAARQQSEADATLASHKAEAAAALAAYKTQAAATLAACKAEAQMQQSWLESAVREQEDLVAELREEVQALREAAAEAEVAAHDAALHADAAVRDREAAWAESEQLRSSMQQSENLATHHLQQRVDTLGALLATKSRVGQLHQVEGLYHATRDELERLDRENRQLKELVAGGQQQALGGSRLLQALSPGRQRSPPLFLSPQQQGKTRSAVTGKKAVPTPAPQHPAPKPQAAGAPASRQLPGMAWLGPPTAQYAADPEKFLFLRVAGGYAPHYVGVEEQPKASGWVPKDVVRLVQAFRRAYGLKTPEWAFWEPLLLMVDEVYRGTADTLLASAQSKFKQRMAEMKRRLQAAMTYPEVLHASRVAHLKRNLNSMRKQLSSQEIGDDLVLRRMMEKHLHLTNQLDVAMDENMELRRSLFQDPLADDGPQHNSS